MTATEHFYLVEQYRSRSERASVSLMTLDQLWTYAERRSHGGTVWHRYTANDVRSIYGDAEDMAEEPAELIAAGAMVLIEADDDGIPGWHDGADPAAPTMREAVLQFIDRRIDDGYIRDVVPESEVDAAIAEHRSATAYGSMMDTAGALRRYLGRDEEAE